MSDVNHALQSLRQFIEQNDIESVALPRLATGVGGLDWNDVRPAIEKHLGTLPIPVSVYSTYRRGETAEE